MTNKATLGELDGFKGVASEYKKAILMEKIVNKQLSPFNRTVETLKDKEVFELKVTPEDHDYWMKWGVKFIQKNSDNPTLEDRVEAEKEMCWIDTTYGLQIKGGWEAQKAYLKSQGIAAL